MWARLVRGNTGWLRTRWSGSADQKMTTTTTTTRQQLQVTCSAAKVISKADAVDAGGILDTSSVPPEVILIPNEMTIYLCLKACRVSCREMGRVVGLPQLPNTGWTHYNSLPAYHISNLSCYWLGETT